MDLLELTFISDFHFCFYACFLSMEHVPLVCLINSALLSHMNFVIPYRDRVWNAAYGIILGSAGVLLGCNSVFIQAEFTNKKKA